MAASVTSGWGAGLADLSGHWALAGAAGVTHPTGDHVHRGNARGTVIVLRLDLLLIKAILSEWL